MTRYCPNCRAIVPKNSLNCPQCLTDVPREGWVEDDEQKSYKPSKSEYRENIEKRHKSVIVVMLLAVVPALFGLLGIGHIYRDRRDITGWGILVAGFVLAMLVPVFAIGGILTGPFAILVLPLAGLCALGYVVLALFSIVDAATGGFFTSRF